MTRPTLKTTFIVITTYLFILLFVYAAVSKLLDFENFQVQLGQSPMLSAYAGWVSWGVIILELAAAGLLVFQSTRLLALYLSFFLMVKFTTYIIIILNFSDFVPCSCGGVLEKLGWTEHLLFNMGFILLSFVGIILLRNKSQAIFKLLRRLTFLIGLAVGGVTTLFIMSENTIHERNNFVRRFPPNVAFKENEFDLKLNSYTIAGIDGSHIYLSNVTAPLHMKVLNHQLELLKTTQITIPDTDKLFRLPMVKVHTPDFYFIDGHIPTIMKGNTDDWEIQRTYPAHAFFSKISVIDSTRFVIGVRDSQSNEDELGVLIMKDSIQFKISPEVLEKQVDGVFDVDGTLLYNHQLDKIIYTYFYRNEFIVTDTNLKVEYNGQTIDTISRAQLDVQHLDSKEVKKFSKPPLVVNRQTATYGNYLFVQSGIMGLYEPESSWKRNSVVDVYDLINRTYVHSFYIPHKENKALTEFYIEGDLLICITGDFIMTYRIKLQTVNANK